MATQSSTPVSVIGLGNWGHSLAAQLAACGLLAARVHANPRARRSLRTSALDAPILWLCVPDAAIAATAAWITAERPDLQGQLVIHSSGALDRSVLRAAAQAGARTASVHPVMSFPTRRAVRLAGVRFGIETAEARTQRQLFRLVRRLGGSPFSVASQAKAMYHAAAMFGSPLVVALLAAGVDAMRAAGVGRQQALDLLTPMATATIANVARRGLASSFSGPLARGDAATVKLHRTALAAHPLLAPVYDALARLALADLPSGNPAAVAAALSRRPIPRRVAASSK
jgi:predicted short-subunit dehydrogenase-like oxidoreductase (DUF2520 family)